MCNKRSLGQIAWVIISLLLLAGCSSVPKGRLTTFHLKNKVVTDYTGTRYTEAWFSSPDQLKVEANNEGCIMKPDVRAAYSSRTGYAILTPSMDREFANDLGNLVVSVPNILEREGAKAHLSGRQRVLGRICDVLEITDPQYTARLAVARGSGLVLRRKVTCGSRTIQEETVTELQENQTIPDSVFDVKSIPNVRIVRSPIVSYNLYHLLLEQGGSIDNACEPSTAIAQMLKDDTGHRLDRTNAVFLPKHMPSRFHLLGMAATSTPGSVEVDYIDPNTGDVLLLLQTGEFSHVGQRKVLKRSTITGTKPFNYSITYRRIGDRWCKLAAVNLDERELVRIAKSLSPVQIH